MFRECTTHAIEGDGELAVVRADAAVEAVSLQ